MDEISVLFGQMRFCKPDIQDASSHFLQTDDITHLASNTMRNYGRICEVHQTWERG